MSDGIRSGRPPHPATVVQPRRAFGRNVALSPHPATVIQPKLPFGIQLNHVLQRAKQPGTRAWPKARTVTPRPVIQLSEEEAEQAQVFNIPADGLTKNMVELWEPASLLFETKILKGSKWLEEPSNQVVLFAVSDKTHKMGDYGSTTLYIGKDGYKGTDYSQFDNLWDISILNREEFSRDVALRIVITVNMTRHRTIEALCATMLHEWFIHAIAWQGVGDYIREGKGRFAVAWVGGQGYVRRAAGEHIRYANASDETLAGWVESLALDEMSSGKILKALKDDRERFDAVTGEPL